MNYKDLIGFLVLLFTGSYLISAQDNIPPERPYITYVSVDTGTNNVDVYWHQSPSPDVMQYNIYYEIETVNGWEGIKLDSLPAGNSHYIDTGAEAGLKNILYSVTATDSSGNESLRKPGLHSTVYSKILYDSCNNSMVISWNKYVGWENNVSGYRVYGRDESNSFQLLNGVNAVDSTYTVYNIAFNTSYYYFIEAVKNDGLVSRSNIAHKFTYTPVPPGIMNIDYATVKDENIVELKFVFSDISEIDNFVLLRSSVIGSGFNQIKRISNLSSSPLLINDTILTAHQVFYYKVGALNSCLSLVDTSNLACNILLYGKNTNNINTLRWNSYINFPNGIEVYEIYRQDPEGSYNLIGTNNSSNLEYTDNITSLYDQEYAGKIHYLVKAVENSTGNYSSSNICTVDIRTDILLPNAFTPNNDGKNDEFKPVMNFFPEKYLLIIYNRYGIIVFKSTDPETGWDGKVNGNQPAAEGVYTYHIEYSSYNGQKKVVKPGTVTLFYP